MSAYVHVDMGTFFQDFVKFSMLSTVRSKTTIGTDIFSEEACEKIVPADYVQWESSKKTNPNLCCVQDYWLCKDLYSHHSLSPLDPTVFIEQLKQTNDNG